MTGRSRTWIMRRRRAFVWLVVAAVALATIAMQPILYMGRNAPTFGDGPDLPFTPWLRLAQNLSFLVFPLVGGLMASRRPEHPIGWLMLGFSVLTVIAQVDRTYAIFAIYVATPPAPGAEWVVWLQRWIYVPDEQLIGLMLLLFPTGHLPSSRWRWLGPIAIGGLLLEPLGRALLPGDISMFPGIANPLPVDAPWVPVAVAIGVVLNVAFIIASAASVIVRFGRATGIERQQLKWFVFGAVLVVATIPGTAALTNSGARLPSLVQATFGLSLAALPAATGVAILRYQLYRIDHIISRTISYAIVSALLGAIFMIVILILQAVLAGSTGHDSLAVATSTLVVAALFQPLRRRVQASTDRRFNRLRYDAPRAVESFATLVRNEIDLETISGTVMSAVGQTIAPSVASLWLRNRTSNDGDFEVRARPAVA